MKWIPIVAVMALGACSLTSQERTDLRDVGLAAALVAVETLHEVGVDPVNASPETLKWANAACKLLEVGSPLIVTAINIAVARQNEGTDLVTVEEFTGGLKGVCELITAVLTPVTPADA